MNKPLIGVSLASLAILIGGVTLMSLNSPANIPPYEECVTHGSTISMHIHPQLEIVINNEKVPVPANIGISSACMKALHTHDESGVIHAEYPVIHNFTLGNFFTNWGRILTKEQLFDNKVDEKHTLTMTVDGQPNDQFNTLLLKDGQKISIKYEEKK